MTKSLDPFRLLLIAVCGWMNQQQLQLIGCEIELLDTSVLQKCTDKEVR